MSPRACQLWEQPQCASMWWTDGRDVEQCEHYEERWIWKHKDIKEQPVVSGRPCYLWAMVRFQFKLLLRAMSGSVATVIVNIHGSCYYWKTQGCSWLGQMPGTMWMFRAHAELKCPSLAPLTYRALAKAGPVPCPSSRVELALVAKM